ncbi:hypothetical protein M436DRAFT_85594 [Aureobasidium namibiae CBS 147.97]|uniref:Uncharacterized protein n=1 Tax=Aureobasidium namibiae CBS 147.97 TaxID=1043004 RepID=A0A074WCL1_9PEZI
MKTRSASANSGAQRVVDGIKEEPADETLAQVDHDLQPLNTDADNHQTDTHAVAESNHDQSNTFVSRMMTRSSRLNTRITSPTAPEPGTPTSTPTAKPTKQTPTISTGRKTRSVSVPTTTTTTAKVAKATRMHKPLPPIPAVLAPAPNAPKNSTSTSKTSLFRTLSPAQKVSRKRKLSTIRSTLKQKSVEQLTDLYNSTEDPDFQTLMTEVYHENCMSRLDEWEKSLLDED